MEEVLEELLNLPGAQGAFVVGKDGLVIASAGDTDTDPETLGAAAAELVTHMETTFKNRGTLNVLEYSGDAGNCYLAAINEVTYLYLQTKLPNSTGRLRLGLKSACHQLREQL
jgi:predicted regulator of Ras-like GTPase activity (Roadblock/LC7/MglB family)